MPVVPVLEPLVLPLDELDVDDVPELLVELPLVVVPLLLLEDDDVYEKCPPVPELPTAVAPEAVEPCVLDAPSNAQPAHTITNENAPHRIRTVYRSAQASNASAKFFAAFESVRK